MTYSEFTVEPADCLVVCLEESVTAKVAKEMEDSLKEKLGIANVSVVAGVSSLALVKHPKPA